MKVTILSHEKVLNYNPLSNNSFLIRITDTPSKFIDLTYPSYFESILELKFYDFTEERYDELNLYGSSINLISESDAIKVVDFFESCLSSNIDELVIHCEEGVSRSSAVAISYCRFIKDVLIENEIWDNIQYIPNLTVIDKIEKEILKRNIK